MAAAASAVKYVSVSHLLLPSPILNLLVSISNPISPAASIGLADVHVAAVPLRCCILVAIFYLSSVGLPLFCHIITLILVKIIC
jgi:hypothetical protein